MTTAKELEKLEKKQEKVVELKKAYTEKAKEKGDFKSIEKAQAEEDTAITILEKIREDKSCAETEKHLRNYVEHMVPLEIDEIAKALNLAPETIEKHIEALGMVKDANGKVYRDRNSMSTRRLEEWKKKREVVIKKWSEIAEKNQGLTQEELKEIYIRHYPEGDEDIERYLKERKKERDNVEIEEKENSRNIEGIHDILLIFLIIFVVLIVVSCLGTCI